MDRKILIADDDAGMRLVLKKVIEKTDGFKVVSEAQDGEEALNLAVSTHPNVAFMDVDMPVLSGVDVAKKLIDIDPKIIIIFATAHEEYMLEAFELYAFDYLLKPFKIERVKQTLERIKGYDHAEDMGKVNKLITHDKRLDKIMIRNKEGISLVDMKEIILIQREDRSTAIYTEAERFVTSEGLSEIEERLDKDLFIRSHKSYIINLTMINRIQPYGRWTYVVKFKNTDKDALLTSEKYEVLEKIFCKNV